MLFSAGYAGEDVVCLGEQCIRGDFRGFKGRIDGLKDVW